MYNSCTVYNFDLLHSFSKMYKHKSGWQKRKERAVQEENRDPTKRQKTLKCLGFVTNTFTDIARNDLARNDFTNIARNDDRDLHNDSSAEHEIADLASLASSSYHENTTSLAEAVNSHSDEACARPGHVPTVLAQPIAIVEHHAVAEKIQHVSIHDYDAGLIENEVPSPAQVREAVQCGSENFPTHFPDDEYGHSFPTSILQASLQNGEVIQRDWLAWSKTKKALFCFPCRLFSKLPSANRSF